MTPLPEILDEARRLLAVAGERAVPIRLIGGVAIRLRADAAFSPQLAREYADIDLVTLKGRQREVAAFIEGEGYAPQTRFNTVQGHERLLFHAPDNGRRLDVFVGAFRMCHEIPIDERILLHPQTVALAELLLSKLQIVSLNEKDRRDAIALLLHHDVAEADGETINAAQVARLCADDWGLWRTCKLTIERIREGLGEYDLAPSQRELVDQRLTRLWERIEHEPKSRGWRMRDRIGDRKQWYDQPEEIAT